MAQEMLGHLTDQKIGKSDLASFINSLIFLTPYPWAYNYTQVFFLIGPYWDNVCDNKRGI